MESKLFLLTIVFLPFTDFRMSFLFVGSTLSKIFILAGIVLYMLKIANKKVELTNFEKFFAFYLLIFFLWQCLCTLVGILEYDYYTQISLEQMDKLRYLLQSLGENGLHVSDVVAIKIWLALRFLKDCFSNAIFSYGTTLWVFHSFYRKRTNHNSTSSANFCHLNIGITVLCLLMITYSIIEVGYLTGNITCANILAHINPLFYTIKQNHGWWPPLLWQNQLRSLFIEPSYFGIISVIITPVLVFNIFDQKNKVYVHWFYVLIFYAFAVMIFLARARTATILFAGQMMLFVFFTFIYKRIYIKILFHIIFIALLSFGTSLYIISCFQVVDLNTGTARVANIQADAATYVSNNMISAIGNARSNNARFANVKATFVTGLHHPLFGVGMGLKDAYIKANFSAEDLTNYEVYNWMRYSEEKGVLKASIPVLNQFSGVIASFGVIGLFLYLVPMLYIPIKLFGILKRGMDLETACLTIGIVASVVAMFSNSAFLPYYILEGILFAYINSIAVVNKTKRGMNT